MGWGVSAFPGVKNVTYEGVRFNVISVTRGWVGVKFPGIKRYVVLSRFNKIAIQGTPRMAVDYEARAYRESTHIVIILSVTCLN